MTPFDRRESASPNARLARLNTHDHLRGVIGWVNIDGTAVRSFPQLHAHDLSVAGPVSAASTLYVVIGTQESTEEFR